MKTLKIVLSLALAIGATSFILSANDEKSGDHKTDKGHDKGHDKDKDKGHEKGKDKH